MICFASCYTGYTGANLPIFIIRYSVNFINLKPSAISPHLPRSGQKIKKQAACLSKQPVSFCSLDCFLKRLVDVESLLEALDASAGVDQLLLTCEEGVAVGADFNTQVLLCGACYEGVATCACNCCLLVVGMDSLFHSISPRI